MKQVILSADNAPSVYLVPDVVADNLEKYCYDFCSNWIWTGEQREKYIINGVACYTEKDFIEYLNNCIFPHEMSKWVETLSFISNREELPSIYKDCSWFNF